MYRLLTILFCLLFTIPLSAQTNSTVIDSAAVDTTNLGGYWKGKITQYKGGYSSEYNFELFLEIEGNKVTGRSYVSIDSIFVEMTVTGELYSGVMMRLEDGEIIDHRITPGMEWCDKTYQMIIKREKDQFVITGYWQGKTTFSNCIPGKLSLSMPSPRA